MRSANDVLRPYRPGYHLNPYAPLAELRRRTPVYRHAGTGHVFVTGYDDCATVLRDDSAFSTNLGRAGGALRQRAEQQRRIAPLGNLPMLGASDAPVHTRLRRAVNQPFTPAAAEAMLPRVEAITQRVLADIPRDGAFNFVDVVADRLPSLVMLELLGVPGERQDDIARWLTAIERVRENADFRPAAVEQAREAAEQLTDYVENVDRRGEEPRDNLPAILLASDDNDDPLSLAEVLSLVVHIALVGNGPAGGLLSNSLLALLQHREQWETLRADPSLVPNAVHELLRYDSSTHAVPRVATRDSDLGAFQVNRGDLVFAVVGAANRDPAQFEDPDRLDIQRDARTHLSFGQGIHFCLGGAARPAGSDGVAVTLAATFPAIELDDATVEWAPTFELRTPDRLMLRTG